MNRPRRVVTGHDADGRSVVLSDGPTPRSHDIGVAVFHELWNTNAKPAPVAATEPEPTARPPAAPPPPGPRPEPRPPSPPRAPPPAHKATIILTKEAGAGARSPMHRTESI